MGSKFSASTRTRRAFTLLELMLSLALTGLILLAVGMALDLHMRSFQKRRTTIEESQLARTILRIIADDIRAAVRYEEPDLASYEKMLAGLSPADAAGLAGLDASMSDSGSLDAMLDPGGGTDDGASTDATVDDETASNSQDLAAATTIPTTPGIYGNQYELQIDVSRLPRIEEYQPLMAADPLAAMMDLPSDVKTVTYYVQAAGTGMPGMGTAGFSSANSGSTLFAENPADAAGGLVRREMDRSITQWAVENGNVTGLLQAGEVIAPEVVAIEFRYFDGIQWLTEWDMATQQVLPMAIEVVLAMQPLDSEWRPAADTSPESILTQPQVGIRYYRMVIHVPTGEPNDGTTMDETGSLEPSETEAAATTF